MVNWGPTNNVPTVITLRLVSSPACTHNSSPITINNPGMPIGVNVVASRRWTVTCNTAGPVSFTLTASVAPTGAFAGSDPDMSNNGGTATAITDVTP